MSELVLEFHKWRPMKPEADQDLAALFLFSLLPRDAYEAGRRPSHNECFWTEVSLAKDLAERDGWKGLGKDDKYRAMFQHAVESVRASRRMLRQAPLFWTATNGLERGPRQSDSPASFPKMPPLVFPAEAEGSSRFGARAGAGH